MYKRQVSDIHTSVNTYANANMYVHNVRRDDAAVFNENAIELVTVINELDCHEGHKYDKQNIIGWLVGF